MLLYESDSWANVQKNSFLYQGCLVLAAVAKQRERGKNEHDDRKRRGKEVQVTSQKYQFHQAQG